MERFREGKGKVSGTSQYSIHDVRNCGCEEKGIAMPVAVAPTGPLGKKSETFGKL